MFRVESRDYSDRARQMLSKLGIVRQRRISRFRQPWVWKTGVVLLLAGAGGYAAYRGFAAGKKKSAAIRRRRERDGGLLSKDVHVRQSILIGKPAAELYAFWRDLSNLPFIMRHVQEVEVIDRRRSVWTVLGPGNAPVRWDAVIVEDRENEFIGWTATSGSLLAHCGSVTFDPAASARGTIVRIHLTYSPAGGTLGSLLLRLFRREPGQEIHQDLRRFKQMMETGEVAASESPSARGLQRARRIGRKAPRSFLRHYPDEPMRDRETGIDEARREARHAGGVPATSNPIP